MSDYFERIEQHLVEATERRASARSRPAGALRERLSATRWWLQGRRPGLLALAAVLVLSSSAAGAVLLSAEHSRGLSGVVPPYQSTRGTISLTGSHYEISITPSLRAGVIGWCNFIAFDGIRGHFFVSHGARGRRTEPAAFGGGTCGTGTPAVGSPLFATDGSLGAGLWYVLAAPQVAAVRVANGPTVLTRGDPRLPYGYRAAVFTLARKSFAHGFPRVTALDAEGHAIPGGAYAHPAQDPTQSWSDPARPVAGACPLRVQHGTEVELRRGTVVTAVVPDPGIIGHACRAPKSNCASAAARCWRRCCSTPGTRAAHPPPCRACGRWPARPGSSCGRARSQRSRIRAPCWPSGSAQLGWSWPEAKTPVRACVRWTPSCARWTP